MKLRPNGGRQSKTLHWQALGSAGWALNLSNCWPLTFENCWSCVAFHQIPHIGGLCSFTTFIMAHNFHFGFKLKITRDGKASETDVRVAIFGHEYIFHARTWWVDENLRLISLFCLRSSRFAHFAFQKRRMIFICTHRTWPRWKPLESTQSKYKDNRFG